MSDDKKYGFGKINLFLTKIDGCSLWWIGLVLYAIIMSPIFILGEGTTFSYHDQLDESMMSFVLSARHFGEETLPEMMNGISTDSLSSSSLLFLLPFRFLPAFIAYLTCLSFNFFVAYFGMYLLVKEWTKSSILATLAASFFSMLPLHAIYGTSLVGIPFLFWAFICLFQNREKIKAYVVIAIFALSSHLVYGYAQLGLIVLAWIIFFIINKKKVKKGEKPVVLLRYALYGFLELLLLYVIEFFRILKEVFAGTGFVSHRSEWVNQYGPFWKNFITVFTKSSQHAETYQYALFPLIALCLVMGIIFRKKLDDFSQKRLVDALGLLVILIGIAAFYAFWYLKFFAEFRDRSQSFLHYFNMTRFYWMYPAGWYLEMALAASVWFGPKRREELTDNEQNAAKAINVKAFALLILFLIPAFIIVLMHSIFYRNVAQLVKHNNISWEAYYSEDVMQQLDDAIGRDKSTYRIAHVNMTTAPALMHGFYTVDGYSNNYDIEYKYVFRKVIADELDVMGDAYSYYYDKWGSRVYLFNHLEPNEWMCGKGWNVSYTGLLYDMQALKDLGCEYLFSAGYIIDYERMGLTYMGCFETETSYWRIYLYALN